MESRRGLGWLGVPRVGVRAHLAALVLVLLGQVCARLEGLDLGAAGQRPAGVGEAAQLSASRLAILLLRKWFLSLLAVRVGFGCRTAGGVAMCPADFPIPWSQDTEAPWTYPGSRGVQFCQPPDSQAGQVVCLVGGHGCLGESTRAKELPVGLRRGRVGRYGRGLVARGNGQQQSGS